MTSTDTSTRVSIILDVRTGGDSPRWPEFYAIYKPILQSYFRKQGLSDSDANDLTQDVFLKLLRNIKSYDRTRTRFRTWLFTVARHALIDRARRQSARKRAMEDWVKHALATADDEEARQRKEFEEDHHRRILRFAFEQVRRRSSERVWNCFEQSVIQGRPGADVAAELNVSTNVVYVNSWRVLQAVKKLCHRYDEDLRHDPDDRVS